MREILFKGKRKGNGGWVEGYYVRLYDSKGNVSHRIYPGYAESDCGEFYPDWYEVDPETVGQYTGLTDKNGTKIFEWDIVRFWDVNVGYSWDAVVVFGNPNGSYSWGWQLRPLTRCKGILDILLWVEMEEGGVFCKVIGNIHDNPELLKGETNE